MLFVSINALDEEQAPGQALDFANIRRNRNGIAMKAATASPYGFWFEENDVFVAGETFGNGNDASLRESICEFIRRPNSLIMPPSCVLTFVAVDFARGEAVAVAGASCSRPLVLSRRRKEGSILQSDRPFSQSGGVFDD